MRIEGCNLANFTEKIRFLIFFFQEVFFQYVFNMHEKCLNESFDKFCDEIKLEKRYLFRFCPNKADSMGFYWRPMTGLSQSKKSATCK